MNIAAQSTIELETPTKPRSNVNMLLDRLGLALSGLSLAAAAVGIIYCLILAISWYNLPFLGVLTSHSLVVNATQPLTQEKWAGLDAGLQPGDQILALDNISFESVADPGPALNDA